MLRGNPESTDRKVQIWHECFLFLLLLLDPPPCWSHSASAAAVIFGAFSLILILFHLASLQSSDILPLLTSVFNKVHITCQQMFMFICLNGCVLLSLVFILLKCNDNDNNLGFNINFYCVHSQHKKCFIYSHDCSRRQEDKLLLHRSSFTFHTALWFADFTIKNQTFNIVLQFH